jgi:biopolymer transport protein TolR
MAMTLAAGGKAKAEINMTPMIDVLLVLIIIFMVIAPVLPRGLEALVPQPPDSGAVARPANDVVVTVRADGTILLNLEPLDLAQLQPRLARIYQNAGARVIFVRGENGIEFRQVADVIDIALSAGVYRVGLMTN